MNAKSVRQVAFFFTYIRTAVEMGFDSLPLSKKLVCFRNGTVYYAILFSTTIIF